MQLIIALLTFFLVRGNIGAIHAQDRTILHSVIILSKQTSWHNSTKLITLHPG